MKKETKQNIKQKVIDKPVTNIKSTIKQKQNRLISYLAFLLLLFLLVSFMVPVYYVPLFKKISTRYGLTSNITKKLTLFDLALNSLGIETSNMSAAFQKQDIEYGHDVFYTSRFSLDGKNRLINAKETYYHEYEKTKKRPAEIAGIYKDSTDINIPEIDGNLRGIRALPKGDFRDDNFDLNYKKNDIAGNLGGKRRHVRGSFDRSGENVENQSGAEKHEPLPDFAASIYVQDETEEAQTLNNSRMVKPIVEGEPFSVARSQNVIAKLVGDSSFTDTFAALKNFGGYGGALGYYIKDDLPKEGLFDFFGNSGRDAFTSYFYSHAAIDRKYIESSKHLSEIAFHGDERQDKILIAKGQKNDKIPTINETETSPLSFVLTVKRNMQECEDGREKYLQEIKPLQTEYKRLKEKLKDISSTKSNRAKSGAPGACNRCLLENGNGEDNENCWPQLGGPTSNLRNQWNNILENLKEVCLEMDQKGKEYAMSCSMEYKRDELRDTCDSILALKTGGGIGDLHLFPLCEKRINWTNLDKSPTFNGCGGESMNEDLARKNCEDAQNALFKAIDENIQLDTKPGFMFN